MICELIEINVILGQVYKKGKGKTDYFTARGIGC